VPASPRDSLFRKIWPPLPVWRRLDAAVLLTVVYTVLVTQFVHLFTDKLPTWIGELGVVNAVLLGVLLSFRNKEAYDRWWEARKTWGQLINECRNLLLKAAVYAGPGADDRRAFGRLVVGTAVAMKNHLRGVKTLRVVPGFEGDPADPSHVPAYLAMRAFETVRDWRRAGRLTDIEFLAIDPHVKAFMDVIGVCERIQSSPVPLSYRALLRHGTILYLLSAPWFLTGEYGYWGVAVVALLTYFLLGTELTAEDVEDPFGRDGDDLELGKYCDTIRRSAEQILGVDLDVGGLTVSPDRPKNPPAK
jgi:putative membrane protein